MLLSKLVLLLASAVSSLTIACSTFCTGTPEKFVVAKSYDWI